MGQTNSKQTEGVQIRKLSIQRPDTHYERSFNSYYESQWMVPILIRHGVHRDLCNTTIGIKADIDINKSPDRALTFEYPREVLRHTLRRCKNLKIAIQFDFYTSGLSDKIKELDPEFYEHLSVKGTLRDVAHANMLMIYRSADMKKLIVEHFEPHGSQFNAVEMNLDDSPKLTELSKQVKQAYKDMLDTIPIIIQRLSAAPADEVVYYPPNKVCPFVDGPQALEGTLSSKMDMEGFCKTWSWAWVDLRLQNMHVPPEVLTKELLKMNSNSLFKLVMDYAYYARNLYYHYTKVDGNPERYAKVGLSVVDKLNTMIPTIESEAGVFADSVIDSAIFLINRVPDAKSMENLSELLPELLGKPDTYSLLSKIMHHLTGAYIPFTLVKTIESITKKLDASSGRYSTKALLERLETKKPREAVISRDQIKRRNY